MKRAILLTNPELMVQLFKVGEPRMLDVFAHALPADAKVVDVRFINSRNEIAIELESETFNHVPENGQPPVLSAPQCRLVVQEPAEDDGLPRT